MLVLLNTLGQRILTQNLAAGQTVAVLPTAGLATGRYVLQAVSAAGVTTQSLVLQ